MSLVNVIIFILAAGTLIIAYVRRKFAFWADKNVQFIKPTFPFGNLSGFGGKRGLYEITQQHYNTMKSSYAKFAGLYFFIQPVVLGLDLDFVKTVMIKDFQSFHDRGLYHNVKDDPLTGHLFLIEGEKWRSLRTKLSPTFTSGKMKMMFPTIVAVGEQFKTTLQDSLKINNDIDIRDILARFTTDVIGTCAFGLECNSLKDPQAKFRQMGKKVFQSSSFFLKAIVASQFKTISQKLGVTLLPKDVTSFFMGAVKDTIENREANNIRRNDFMNMLIDMKNCDDPANRFTVEEIAAQAFVFFVAGFETSSTAMAFALYELAQNQELQSKARECVRTVLNKHDNKFTYEAMMEMTYITQCINGIENIFNKYFNFFVNIILFFRVFEEISTCHKYFSDCHQRLQSARI
jgi:cytochrome P450 family 6